MSGKLPPVTPSFSERAGFFYSNLQIQAAASTIRHGIEARKGLIVMTGEPGVGKSTLLHKVSQDLAANVTWMIESEPPCSFVDSIRLLARRLDFDDPGDEEAAILRACKIRLRERLEYREIVALMIDNAHAMSEQALRRITQNFLAASAEDPDGTLLQLVLAGRPELRLKLADAALVPLRRRPPIWCELHPVESREIAAYVQGWLRWQHYSGELFDERAIKRVALYTRGNLRDIDFLCDRALRLAGSGTATVVSAEVIERAANEINLRQPQSVGAPLKDHDLGVELFDSHTDRVETHKQPERFEKTNPYEKTHSGNNAPDFTFFRDNTVPETRTFPSSNATAQFSGHSRRPKHTASWLQGFTVLIVFVAAVAMVRIDNAFDILAGWNAALERLSAHPVEAPADLHKQPELPKARATHDQPLVPLPGPDSPALSNYEQAPGISSRGKAIVDARSDSASNHEASGPSRTKPESEVASPPKNSAAPGDRRGTLQPANAKSQDLQLQVTRAIENRAIMGVEVSVVEGTAYLDGQVATERQRRAAERAARSVSGVQRVNNRIAITFG